MEIIGGVVIVFVLGVVSGWTLKTMLEDLKKDNLEKRINRRKF